MCFFYYQRIRQPPHAWRLSVSSLHVKDDMLLPFPMYEDQRLFYECSCRPIPIKLHIISAVNTYCTAVNTISKYDTLGDCCTIYVVAADRFADMLRVSPRNINICMYHFNAHGIDIIYTHAPPCGETAGSEKPMYRTFNKPTLIVYLCICTLIKVTGPSLHRTRMNFVVEYYSRSIILLFFVAHLLSTHVGVCDQE